MSSVYADTAKVSLLLGNNGSRKLALRAKYTGRL